MDSTLEYCIVASRFPVDFTVALNKKVADGWEVRDYCVSPVSDKEGTYFHREALMFRERTEPVEAKKPIEVIIGRWGADSVCTFPKCGCANGPADCRGPAPSSS